jgi:hypothetical protein
MPVASSMSSTVVSGNHQVTVRVWYAEEGGYSRQEEHQDADVSIQWAPQALGMASKVHPNPDPSPTFQLPSSGIVAWSGQCIRAGVDTEEDPKIFRVTLACLQRAITSVSGTVTPEGESPQQYSAGIICP